MPVVALEKSSPARCRRRFAETWKVDATDTPVNFCATSDACGDTGDHYSNPASPPASVLFPYGFGLSYGAPGPNCTDGIKNGTETDIDCGGSCTADCANGKLCSVNGDCQSNNCVMGTCQPPVGNTPPMVSISAPANGSSIVAGSTVVISASASDSDGTVSNVRFFAGASEILPADTSSPYSVSWAVPTGPASYSLTARATDSGGATTTSVAVGISATSTCSDGVLNGSETGIDCGGSCAACTSSSPCTSLCTSPILFTGPNFNSGNLGTSPTCHQTVANLAGGNCGNFVSPRTLAINGTIMSCTGGNWSSLPAKRNGGYCIQTTAGDNAWAYFATF